MDVYDVIVIGAGIEGSSTAYHLAKAGQHTLLLEQFRLGHGRGSSHGASRLYRKGYDKKYKYSELNTENQQLWETLETECGTKMTQETGVLFVARPPYDENVKRTVTSLQDQNLPYEYLTADEINRKFPMMRYSKQHGDVGVYEPSGGVILSDLALKSFQTKFTEFGGILKDQVKVTKIIPRNSSGNITIETNTRNTYQCKYLVITVGSWTSKVVTELGLSLPLQPKRIKVCYWRQIKKQYRIEDGFPVFIADGLGMDLGVRNYMYGIPAMEHPDHVKICSHYGEVTNPDEEGIFYEKKDLEDLCLFVKKYFPGLESKPGIMESCIITTTPDEEFIIDKHPLYNNIVIGAGFSGHGFKLAPVLGKMLSQLAVDIQPQYDLTLFKINRFQNVQKADPAKL